MSTKFYGDAKTILGADKVDSDETEKDCLQILAELLNTLTADSSLLDCRTTLKI